MIEYNISGRMQQQKTHVPGKRPAAVRYASFMGHMGRATPHKPVAQGVTKSAQVTTQVTAQVETMSGPSRNHVARRLPDKLWSSKQKYRLTDKGRVFMEGGRNRE